MQAKTAGRPVSRGPLERLTVLVNETVKDRLRKEAEYTGASMSLIVERALVEYLGHPK